MQDKLRRWKEDDTRPGTPSSIAAPGRRTLTHGYVMRKSRDDNGVAAGADDAVARASGSSGATLPSELRGRFESSLGADLGGVRVHTDAASVDAADAVGAKAYTVGNDIHFGAGQYDPSSSDGQFLIAHEVAHTVQQSGGAQRTQYKLEVSSPGDAAEVEADRAASSMITGAPAMVTGGGGLSRSVLQREAAEGGGAKEGEGGGKGPAFKSSVSLPALKTGKVPLGYVEAEGSVKFTVECEQAEGGEKKKEGEGGEAETEVKVSPEGVEAEVKKTFYEGKNVSFEGSIGDGINWKERKFELGAGLTLKCGNDSIQTEIGGKFIPFTIDDGGVHIGEFKLSGKGSPKDKPSVTVGGAKINCTPSIDWEIAVELNEEKVGEELLKQITSRLGGATAGSALVPAAMIANGVLSVFMVVDSFLAADDIKNLVEAGPAATAKAREFIQQTAADLKSGNGDAITKLSQDIGKDFGGAIPKGMLVKALADHCSFEEIQKIMWPPMRQQIIERSVAEYRSKHKVESAFHDATTWVGEHVFDVKDNHRSSYGDDDVRNVLDGALPAAL